MLKTNKKQSVIFFFVKLILFVAVGYIIYSQLSGIDEKKWEDFSIKHPISLIVAILLVVPNIWCSLMQWKVTLRVMDLDNDRKRTVHSFFAGLITGMLTPNMVGNFIGRFYYFDKDKRGTITFLTLVSNYSHLLSTLIFGLVAVFSVGEIYQVGSSWQWLLFFVSGCVLAFFLYFFIEKPLKWLKRVKFLEMSQTILKEHPRFRWNLIFWSMARFVVFTIQSSLVLHAFGEVWSLDLLLAIWQVYLITLMVPSLFLGKLGVKEAISVGILGALGLNEVSIFFASLIIWFVNSMSPALVGLIICDRPKE